jgi:hypothetical protein
MVENEKTKEQVIEIPIKWHIPDTIITRYANNMVIQIIENEFKISFFEMKLPIRIGDNLPPPTEAEAECVASVIVSPAKLPQFIEVMQKHFNKFKTRKKIE